MASRHPLDVFRSSANGFEQASRTRRTISGKVITSRARDGEDAPSGDDTGEAGDEPLQPEQAVAPKPKKIEPRPMPPKPEQAKRAPKQPRRKKNKVPEPRSLVPEPGAVQAPKRVAAAPSRAAPVIPTPQSDSGRVATTLVESEPRPLSAPPLGVRRKGGLKAMSQMMLYGSCLVILALMVWVGVQHDWSGSEPLKQASAADLIAAGPGSEVSAATGEVFTIQAASYSPSKTGQLRAWEAFDALEARGYTNVLVTGDQQADASGDVRLTSCVLLVGRSTERSQLESVLASLGAIDDWPTGAASPFQGACIVLHPHESDG
ncbi:MAG: hypothetical protein ACI9EF_002373 [Pseudohongiellaceae bacterium]|jgi:hypothetical protein